MSKQSSLQMPGAFGGLMRYNDEYKSRFMFEPKHVIMFIVAIIAFIVLLNLFFPIN